MFQTTCLRRIGVIYLKTMHFLRAKNNRILVKFNFVSQNYIKLQEENTVLESHADELTLKLQIQCNENGDDDVQHSDHTYSNLALPESNEQDFVGIFFSSFLIENGHLVESSD